jgi:integrase
LEEPARLKDNPFERIRRKQLKTNVRRELSIAELKAIIEKAEGELQTLFMLGTFTGLRLGDCCTLKWGEVDLDRGLIRRIPNKTAKSGKPVTVGIPAALYAKLSETPKVKRKGYVVPKYAELYNHTNEKGEPIRRPLITREIKHIFEKCEIQTQQDGTGKPTDENRNAVDTGKRAVVDVSFHSLRHTWVSMQAEAGTPQAVVQSIIGHSNPAMTAHYTHIGEGAALEAAKVITLNEPKQIESRVVPPWIQELAETMTVENLEEIKAVLVGGKE